MEQQDILLGLRACAVTALDVEGGRVVPEAKLFSDLGADSLDLLDLVFQLERRFQIKLSMKDLEHQMQEDLAGASVEVDGVYTAEAMARIRRVMTEVPPEELPDGLKVADLPKRFPVATLLRFGRWDAILAEPPPPDALTLDRGVWLYARGFAHANKGDLRAAAEDRDGLAKLVSANYGRYDAYSVPAGGMIGLSLALLDGEIARVSGRLNEAIADFRKAAALEHSLAYSEPPYWHQPVSHLLGAALMQAGRPTQAETVYRESLKFYRVDG